MIILFTLKRFCITEYSPNIILLLCFVNGELTFGSCLNNYPLKFSHVVFYIINDELKWVT